MNRPRLLSRLAMDAAHRRADAPAIRRDDETLSYGQLARRANGLARVLVSAGLERGDRVAVWLGRDVRVPVSFHGTFVAGGTLVPIDPKSPLDQVTAIVRATGATHLVTEASRAEDVLRVLADCPGVRQVVGLDADAVGIVPCSSWRAVAEEESDSPPDVRVIELDPAYILHTSGSTGQPKLILHTHYSAMSFVDWAVEEYGLTSRDRLTNHSSHHTCFATFDFYAAAGAGATTVMLTPAALLMPGTLSALLEREGVTVWYSVPAALVQLSLRGDLESRDLGALRWVLFAGETFPGRHLRRLREQLPRARFSHVYGSTEVNVCTCFHLPAGELPPGALPIGRACSTSRTLVADASMQPVSDGEVGDLFVRGSTLMSAYWDDPERSRQALVQRPDREAIDGVYYRTGDRARVLPDGNLAFVARADRQVKIRGHRVELDEVEGALLSLSTVDEAAAFTVPDAEGSSALHAAVVTGGGSQPDGRTLRGELRAILPPHALPSRIIFVESMPRTPTGKVDVRALIAAGSERVQVR
jgi:amino acid adenylation domain-containing protein